MKGSGEKIKLLADQLLTREHFAVDDGGLLYVYEQGCYRPHGKETIARRTKAMLLAEREEKWWSTHLVAELAAFIATDCSKLWKVPSADTLNVKNGLLDLSTLTLRPHTPMFLSPIQLPVTFDAEATCPKWDQFLVKVFPSDAIRLAHEVAASLIQPSLTIQKALLLVGEGANGKSTFLTGLTAFIGRENVTNISLHALEADKFAKARLVGKLANIVADLPASVVDGSSIFKTIIGGDSLTAERKFCASFEFQPYARQVFSANAFPRSKDASHAFFRRWTVIPFDRTFAPSEQVSRSVMDAELADPVELSGLLNHALAVLPALMRRGDFSKCESVRSAWMEFREATDPFASWLDSSTRLRPDTFVSKNDLAIAFSAYAQYNQYPLMSSKALGQAIKRLRPGLAEGQRTIAGELKHCWLGLELISPDSQDSQDSHHFSQINVGDRSRDLNRRNPVNPVTSPFITEEITDLDC